MAHAHNVVLQVLFAWGIAGFACVTVIAGWIAKFLVAETKRCGGLMPAFVLAGVAMLAQSAVDGCAYDVSSLNILSACLGAAAGLALRDHNREEPQLAS